MSAAPPETARRFEAALGELAVVDVLELLKSESKRGPRSDAWKLPETMLAAAVLCRLDPTCTYEQTLERVPGLAEEMDLRSVSDKSLARFVARAAEAYKDLRVDDARTLRKMYETLAPGVDEQTVREMSARALRMTGISALAAIDPETSKPLDLYAAAAMLRAASDSELADAKAAFAAARTREIERAIRSAIDTSVERARAGIINDPRQQYTTEEVADITRVIAERIGDEFRRLAEGDDA